MLAWGHLAINHMTPHVRGKKKHFLSLDRNEEQITTEKITCLKSRSINFYSLQALIYSPVSS